MNELYNPDGTLAVYKAETEIEEQKKNSASNSYCVSEYHGRVYQPWFVVKYFFISVLDYKDVTSYLLE